MNRYYVKWSNAAEAYAVFDRQQNVPSNSTGHAMIWGTDHPNRSLVDLKCHKLNGLTKI